MEITNLAQPTPTPPQKSPTNILLVLTIAVVAITLGFWLSRLSPVSKSSISLSEKSTNTTENTAAEGNIKVGASYGNSGKNFSDTATGVIEKGSINGEGTHILIREGGVSQRASLTSSVVDLDLFVGRKVEVKGETNSSNKTGWLLDVGAIKVLE